MRDDVRDDPIEGEHQKEGRPEKSKGMDWESMGKDVFDMFMLSAFGAMAASILFNTFRPELNTAQNALECGIAYALLAFSFSIRVNRR